MNIKQWLTPALLLCGAVFTSCVDDIPGPDAKELYTRDFVKSFGAFDPKQDWNIANQTVVHVTTSAKTDVKIYADLEGKRFLFGTYLNVLGSKELKVDVPKGVKTLYVKANGKTYTTSVGGSVNIASRAVASPGDDKILSWDDMGYNTFSARITNAFRDQFLEGEPNLGVGTSSFYFISDGEEHTFYPIFSQTDKVHALGIYYIPDQSNPDEIVMQDLYFTKTGDLTIYKNDGTPYTDEEVSSMNEHMRLDEAGYSQARGIKYRIKEGVYYGFYLKCGYADGWGGFGPANLYRDMDEDGVATPNSPYEQDHLFTLFSQATRNEVWEDKVSAKREQSYQSQIRTKGWSSKDWWDPENFTDLDDFSYASWSEITLSIQGETKTYALFGFEDWPPCQDGTFCDLNDLVFIFDGPAPEAYDEDADFTWIIACEDLGLDDFDFNDVVFGISNRTTDMESGETTVKIHPLASGGTLEIYLMHDDGTGSKVIVPENTADGEFHSWFKGNHTSSTVINAGGYSATGDPVTITVAKDNKEWTLAHNQVAEGGNMGGFSVKVKNKKGSEIEWTTIEAPSADGLFHEIGEAPQMICLPATWYWPTEKTHILKPYPDFQKWCDDRSADYWYTNRKTSDVVRHSFAKMGSKTETTQPEQPEPQGPTKNPDGTYTVTPTGELTHAVESSWSPNEHIAGLYDLSKYTELFNSPTKITLYFEDYMANVAIGFNQNNPYAIGQTDQDHNGGPTILEYEITDPSKINQLASIETLWIIYWYYKEGITGNIRIKFDFD